MEYTILGIVVLRAGTDSDAGEVQEISDTSSAMSDNLVSVEGSVSPCDAPNPEDGVKLRRRRRFVSVFILEWYSSNVTICKLHLYAH